MTKSLLKSSCTPVVLKYIENFRIKWGPKGVEKDINITESVYKIDNDGYLLD